MYESAATLTETFDDMIGVIRPAEHPLGLTFLILVLCHV